MVEPGDRAGEYKAMKRGRFRAGPYVVVAYLMQSALIAFGVWRLLLATGLVARAGSGGPTTVKLRGG
jgi:hypothetical protein